MQVVLLVDWHGQERVTAEDMHVGATNVVTSGRFRGHFARLKPERSYNTKKLKRDRPFAVVALLHARLRTVAAASAVALVEVLVEADAECAEGMLEIVSGGGVVRGGVNHVGLAREIWRVQSGGVKQWSLVPVVGKPLQDNIGAADAVLLKMQVVLIIIDVRFIHKMVPA